MKTLGGDWTIGDTLAVPDYFINEVKGAPISLRSCTISIIFHCSIGKSSEFSGIVVFNRFVDFIDAVHHKWSVMNQRFIDGSSAEK